MKPNSEKMKINKIETTEPTINADAFDELRAIHEAWLDYRDAQDFCCEDSAE